MHQTTAENSNAGLCRNLQLLCLWGLQPTVNAVNAATGWDMTIEEFWKLEIESGSIKAYNILNGLTPEMEMAVSPRYARDQLVLQQDCSSVKRENMFSDYHKYRWMNKQTLLKTKIRS